MSFLLFKEKIAKSTNLEIEEKIIKNFILYFSGFVFIVVIWNILSLIFSPAIVPYPASVFIKIIDMTADFEILPDLSYTILRTIIGFSAAFIIGLAAGLLSGSIISMEKAFFIPTALLQGAPPMLWVIPLMLIVGTEGLSPIAVVFLVSLPLVIINIQEGRKTITPMMFDMFKIYANSRKMKLGELIIPSLSPYLKSILFLGIILALKSSIIGEWFGAKNGIGRKINEYFYTFDMVSFYATSAVFLVSVGLLAYAARIAGDVLFPVNKRSVISVRSGRIGNDYFAETLTHLDMSNVTFSYGSKKILSIEKFSINPGNIVVLTGDSGCGKTTLAKLTAGILKPHAGHIALPSNPGFLFQDDALLNHLDCFGNASLSARWKKDRDVEGKTLYFLEQCGLKDCESMFPHELSGGMKKRLAFARALLLNPDFMVLDEPFNNLHREARKDLWNLYFKLFAERNIPTLIITHYPEELSDRNIILYQMKNKSLIKI